MKTVDTAKPIIQTQSYTDTQNSEVSEAVHHTDTKYVYSRQHQSG
jgi:hypothetical protein